MGALQPFSQIESRFTVGLPSAKAAFPFVKPKATHRIPRERMSEREVPVLIAGGSLVGLSTALFLGSHGVESLVVERHEGTAIHPRAAHFSQRTIELLSTLR